MAVYPLFAPPTLASRLMRTVLLHNTTWSPLGYPCCSAWPSNPSVFSPGTMGAASESVAKWCVNRQPSGPAGWWLMMVYANAHRSCISCTLSMDGWEPYAHSLRRWMGEDVLGSRLVVPGSPILLAPCSVLAAPSITRTLGRREVTRIPTCTCKLVPFMDHGPRDCLPKGYEMHTGTACTRYRWVGAGWAAS